MALGCKNSVGNILFPERVDNLDTCFPITEVDDIEWYTLWPDFGLDRTNLSFLMPSCPPPVNFKVGGYRSTILDLVVLSDYLGPLAMGRGTSPCHELSKTFE